MNLQDSPEPSIESIITELQALQIKQDTLIKRLKAISSTTKTTETEPDTKPSHIGFTHGDRVEIINRINKYLGKIVSPKDRSGTVTHLSQTTRGLKIHLLTDNGIKTWRYPKNLRKTS